MHDGLGCSAFARRYWRNHCCFLFLQVLRWFTSLRCLRTAYGFSGGFSGISQRGFPHSEIPGSKLICSSPGLIAAYRVLHRLLVPRHSPYTLSSLTIRNSTYACPGFGRRDSGFEVALDSPIPNPESRDTREPYAHCVCVVGKTTVCRIFSCQRNREFRTPDITKTRIRLRVRRDSRRNPTMACRTEARFAWPLLL